MKQCKACPWKKSTVPARDIPNGYCATRHRELSSTIAKPGELRLGSSMRVMACHETDIGKERACVGWVLHQLGPGNNIGLRLLARDGRFKDYRTVGPQHQTLEQTLGDGDEEEVDWGDEEDEGEADMDALSDEEEDDGPEIDMNAPYPGSFSPQGHMDHVYARERAFNRRELRVEYRKDRAACADKIVAKIEADISGRSGLDAAWDDIDDAVKREMREGWARVVVAAIIELKAETEDKEIDRLVLRGRP